MSAGQDADILPRRAEAFRTASGGSDSSLKEQLLRISRSTKVAAFDDAIMGTGTTVAVWYLPRHHAPNNAGVDRAAQSPTGPHLLKCSMRSGRGDQGCGAMEDLKGPSRPLLPRHASERASASD